MALPTYSQTLNTTVATVIDEYGRNPANTLTNGGEKILNKLNRRGRVFLVKDADNVRYPLLYGLTKKTAMYEADHLSGSTFNSAAPGTALSTSAEDFLTHSVYHYVAATENFVFPQSQPTGDVLSYMENLVKAKMMNIWNTEEQLFLTGDPDGDGNPTYAKFSPGEADSGYSAGMPMNILSILNESTGFAGDLGSATSTTFANIKTADVAKHVPQNFETASADGSNLWNDLDNAIASCSYSEMERPTHVMTTLVGYTKLKDLLRDKGAFEAPMGVQVTTFGELNFGGVMIDWTRYWDLDAVWDLNTATATACLPMIGLNLNSLRLNLCHRGDGSYTGAPGQSFSFLRRIGGVQVVDLKSNLYQRVEYKRQFALDGGRRSFFGISGYTFTSA